MPILLVASIYDEVDGKTTLEPALDELLPHSFGLEHVELRIPQLRRSFTPEAPDASVSIVAT
jgi:hypothetical protein